MSTKMQVAISIPDADGLNLSGAVPVTVVASPLTNLSKVELQVDGVRIGSDAASPYTFSWDTTKVADGSHTLKAVAYYKTRKSQSQIAVTVKNAGAAEPPPAGAADSDPVGPVV